MEPNEIEINVHHPNVSFIYVLKKLKNTFEKQNEILVIMIEADSKTNDRN